MTTIQSVLYFDGIDDFLELNQSFSLIRKAITVEFWAKGENKPEETGCLFEINNINRPENEFFIGVNFAATSQSLPYENKLLWLAPYWSVQEKIEKIIQDWEYENIWTHWAFTKDTTTGQMSIYRNGELWHQESGKYSSLVGSGNLCIGYNAGINNHYWKGSLSEFRIWNTERRQAEIQKDMYRRLMGTETGLVAYLPLNEGSGNIVIDKTRINSKGTIYGATWRQEFLTLIETNKLYTLKSPATGLVIDIFWGQASDGAIVWGYFDIGSDGQKWSITSEGIIKSKLGDFALDLKDIPDYEWAKDVVINPINGSLTQQWVISPNGVIKNKSNNYALALIPKDNHQSVIAHPIDESNLQANQQWEITAIS